MGLATLIQVLSELPAYIYFKPISAALGSRGVLYLSAVCYLIRAAWYARVTEPWQVPLFLIEERYICISSFTNRR